MLQGRVPSRGNSQCKGFEMPEVNQETARKPVKGRVGGDRQDLQVLERFYSGAHRHSLAAVRGTSGARTRMETKQVERWLGSEVF